MSEYNKFLERTIAKSQRCIRNWDLSKQIPDNDIKTMEQAVTQCSSKQNRVFYKVLHTQDRAKIEAIHTGTDGFTYGFPDDKDDNYKTTTNPQVLANTLFIFVRDGEIYNLGNGKSEARTAEENDLGIKEHRNDVEGKMDEDRAIGVAAGYLTLTANLLGYETGCCNCFTNSVVKDVLGLDEDVFLLMGVGYGDKTRPRREHQMDPNFTFPTFSKKIKVERV